MKKAMTILMVILFSVSHPAGGYASTVSDLQKKQKTIKSQTQDAKSKLETTTKEKQSAVAEMLSVDADLDKVTEELEVINRELDKTQKKYVQTEQDLQHSVAEKNRQFELLKRRLRFMYMRGKSGYLEILFESKDFTDLINRMEYINRIVEYDRTILESLENAQMNVEKLLDETQIQKNEMQILANQQTAKMESLEQALAQKKSVVNALEADQKKYSEMVKNLDDTDKSLASMISKKQKEAAAKSAASSSKNVSAPYTGGKLGWPVPGAGKISSYYGNRKHPISKRIEFHKGIDIPAKTGTKIAAAEGGTVISTGRQNGYGLTVIVDHGNGLSTLYAHCSSITSKVGQKVKKGDQIAKVGSTGYSTGPHLHFEVRVGGRTTNPVSYLNK